MDDPGLGRFVENGRANRRNRFDFFRVAGDDRLLSVFRDSLDAAFHGAIALRIGRGFTNVLLC